MSVQIRFEIRADTAELALRRYDPTEPELAFHGMFYFRTQLEVDGHQMLEDPRDRGVPLVAPLLLVFGLRSVIADLRAGKRRELGLTYGEFEEAVLFTPRPDDALLVEFRRFPPAPGAYDPQVVDPWVLPVTRYGQTTIAGLESALSTFEEEARRYMLEVIPDLVLNPVYGWWFRAEDEPGPGSLWWSKGRI